jgi:hypothetical protein
VRMRKKHRKIRRGATRGRNAGARFLRIMRFTAACKYTPPRLMAKTATLKIRGGTEQLGEYEAAFGSHLYLLATLIFGSFF